MLYFITYHVLELGKDETVCIFKQSVTPECAIQPMAASPTWLCFWLCERTPPGDRPAWLCRAV